MKILSLCSKKGIGKYNNDILNIFDDFCFVMDGASSLFNDNLFYETSDLFEYMQLLKINIKNYSDIKTNIIEGIKKTNNNFSNLNKYKEYELPTFTISAIKENNENYELFLLCDCLISILYSDGSIENIEDTRFDNTKIKCRKEIAQINDLDINDDRKLEKKREIWRKYRKYANTKDGYPVGSTNPNSIDQGLTKTIKKENIKNILICTDGFYSKLGIPNNSSFFNKKWIESKLLINDNNDDLTYILIGK